ncbi:hypothetical protein IU485_08965 [Nocardia cyriacigeorgica]|uniref:hypothetical protein n=1 Tax=Nocardia cyriacigeorgica TaxID=135487 RepID=UPI001895435A|nr:hypothetical protein [Nocardia cyriacigeorgica]MBF6081485.1 hypothetical protein [Nocardia cyriacigeorgica]
MFGLPSFDTIVSNVGKLVLSGPLGAIVTSNHEFDAAENALNVALGEQSPESIAARTRIKDLADNHFDGEFHDPRIPDSLYGNVRSEDLDELYRKAQAVDVAAMTTLHQAWQARAEKLETGLSAFGPKILAAMEDTWEGEAKKAAAQGIIDYVEKAKSLVSGTKIVAGKVELVKSAVEVTKANVQPSPDTSGWGSKVASWTPGPTWKMNEDRTNAAELATHYILERVYHPGIREGDTGQPRIPLAYNPVQQAGPVPPVTPPGPWPPDGRGGVEPPDISGGGEEETPETSGGEPEDTTTAGVEPGTTSADPSSQTATNPTGLGTTPASTNPASTTGPGTGGLPGTGYTPGGSGSGSGGAGSGPGGWDTGPGGPGSGSGSPGGVVSGGPGRSLPGGGNPAAAAATGAGAGARGNRPMAMGPMMPPAARGKGDDEPEKGKSAIAEALVNQRNGEELTGLDPEHRPKTVPPVLGE